jgi:hypothetical protein
MGKYCECDGQSEYSVRRQAGVLKDKPQIRGIWSDLWQAKDDDIRPRGNSDVLLSIDHVSHGRCPQEFLMGLAGDSSRCDLRAQK